MEVWDMDDNELERAENLLIETAEVMAQFKQNGENIVRNIESKLDKSLGEQRKMITEMVRSEVTRELSVSMKGYVKDMEGARNQMLEQVQEFNAYLHKVNEENKKISSRVVLIVSITLAALVIGGIALLFFFSKMVEQKRLDADMIGRINRANVVRCGDELCAKTGRNFGGGYRVIQQR
jgi:hypothetical protein